MADFAHAMQDPAGTFAEPSDVLSDASLTDEQKLKILEQWKNDAINLQVAEEENMGGQTPTMLSRVNNAISILHEKRGSS